MSNLGGGDLAGVGWAAGIERMAMNLDELSDCDKKIICFFTTSSNLDGELLKIVYNLN